FRIHLQHLTIISSSPPKKTKTHHHPLHLSSPRTPFILPLTIQSHHLLQLHSQNSSISTHTFLCLLARDYNTYPNHKNRHPFCSPHTPRFITSAIIFYHPSQSSH
ncbi:hypothetical protein V8G54_023183, partial [Vigna mungo]